MRPRVGSLVFTDGCFDLGERFFSDGPISSPVGCNKKLAQSLQTNSFEFTSPWRNSLFKIAEAKEVGLAVRWQPAENLFRSIFGKKGEEHKYWQYSGCNQKWGYDSYKFLTLFTWKSGNDSRRVPGLREYNDLWSTFPNS